MNAFCGCEVIGHDDNEGVRKLYFVVESLPFPDFKFTHDSTESLRLSISGCPLLVPCTKFGEH